MQEPPSESNRVAVIPLEYGQRAAPGNHWRAFLRAIAVVLGSVLIFAIGGGPLGLLLGLCVPRYYQSIFNNYNPEFSPASVGFGLGVGQGAALGALVGVLLAFVLTWRELRTSR